MVEMQYERTKKDWFDPKRSLECKMSFEKAFQTEIGIKSKDRFGIKKTRPFSAVKALLFLENGLAENRIFTNLLV